MFMTESIRNRVHPLRCRSRLEGNHVMGTCQRLLLVAIMMLAAHHAAAQTLPWPTDAPRAGTPAPWPGERAPASPMAAPTMAPMVAVPQASPLGGGGGMPPCIAEFAKLRDDVQKRGLAAKAAGQRKVSREEMCKQIMAYSAAELKWVKYTETNVQACGIPAEVVQQLKQVHTNTEQTKEKICAPAPAAAAPSLSDALGTWRLPTPDTKKSAGGTLDTLTGSALSR
jgi:hypothetical protein